MNKSGAYIHTSFKGIGVKVYCFKKNGAGSANITLDGRKIPNIKWNDDLYRFDALLWESGPLEDKEHSIRIDVVNGDLHFDYLKILRVNTEFDPSRPATAENPINASGNLVW